MGPSRFRDAKFGTLTHWGHYAVPAYTDAEEAGV